MSEEVVVVGGPGGVGRGGGSACAPVVAHRVGVGSSRRRLVTAHVELRVDGGVSRHAPSSRDRTCATKTNEGGFFQPGWGFKTFFWNKTNKHVFFSKNTLLFVFYVFYFLSRSIVELVLFNNKNNISVSKTFIQNVYDTQYKQFTHQVLSQPELSYLQKWNRINFLKQYFVRMFARKHIWSTNWRNRGKMF